MNDSYSEAAERAAARLVKEAGDYRDNLVKQVAKVISEQVRPLKEKHQSLSDQHDALIKKCNALARYVDHTDKCNIFTSLHAPCDCGLNDLLAGVEPK